MRQSLQHELSSCVQPAPQIMKQILFIPSGMPDQDFGAISSILHAASIEYMKRWLKRLIVQGLVLSLTHMLCKSDAIIVHTNTSFSVFSQKAQP